MKLRALQSGLTKIPAILKPALNPDSWRSGKTTAERGYGSRWQSARERYLRNHPLCVMCEAKGRVEQATVVDHIHPHRGDNALFWNEANWQPLCAPCHDTDKRRQEQGRG